MDILIAKSGSAGDVVRDDYLAKISEAGEITWLINPKNTVLLRRSLLLMEGKEILAGPPSWNIRRTTYSSAVALRDWFGEHNMPERSMNVVTENAHVRRIERGALKVG